MIRSRIVIWFTMCIAIAAQAAEIEWGLIDVVSSTQSAAAESSLDTAWSTTTCDQPQFGKPGNNYPVKCAFSAYDSDGAGTDYNAELLVSDGSPDLLRPRGGGAQVSGSYSIVTGFDSSLYATPNLKLGKIHITVAQETATDTSSFRWFVEADGQAYVTEVIDADLTTTAALYTLGYRDAVEWFSFDTGVNVADAIGASVGTASLDEMNFTNVTSVGVCSEHTFASPSDWHGLRIEKFEALFPAALQFMYNWGPRIDIPTVKYDYDLTGLTNQVARLNSQYVVLNITGPSDSTKYTSPHPDLAAIIDPTNLCFPKTVAQGGRDLLDEAITAAEASGKKVLVYFGAGGLDSDKAPQSVRDAWKAHIGTTGMDIATDPEAARINWEATGELILRYYAEKFGTRLWGYWFDGGNNLSYEEQRAWKDAIHAGTANPEALAGFGDPVGDFTPGHPWSLQLYGTHWDPVNEQFVNSIENGPWIGNTLKDNPIPTDVPPDGALGHMLFGLQAAFTGGQLEFPPLQAIDYHERIVGAGGMLSWSVPRVSDGIRDYQFALLERIDVVTEKLLPPSGDVAPRFINYPILEETASPDHIYGSSIAPYGHDANNDPLTFSKISGPSWLSVAADGTLSGTPSSADAGLNSWTVQVTDGTTPVTATLNIYVNDKIWDGAVDLVDSTVFTDVLGSDPTNNTAWSTTTGRVDVWPFSPWKVYKTCVSFDVALSILGVNADVTMYDNSPAADSFSVYTADVGASGPGTPGTLQGVVGFDTTGFSYTAPLFSLGVGDLEILNSVRKDDSGGFRWFVQAGGNCYVSEKIAMQQAPVDYSLDNTTPIEWFSFDDTVNVGSAVGASVGTASLQSMNFTNVDAAGIYFDLDTTEDAGTNPLHGINLVSFSTRFTPNGNRRPVFGVDPVYDAIQEADALEYIAYSGTLADDASDPDSDPLTFTKLSGPAWLNVAADGTLSGTPSEADIGRNYWIVQIDDGKDTDTAMLKIVVDKTDFGVIAEADTFVKKGGATENYGADEQCRTKNDGSLSRVSIFRFDKTSLGNLSSAAGLRVELTAGDMGFKQDHTMYLYGVTDGSALQNFVEGTGTQVAPTTDGLAWNDSAAFDTAYDLEINDTAGFFYDPDGGTPGEQPLASFVVSADDYDGTTYFVSSAAMMDFAQASTDPYLTFVLVRELNAENTENLIWGSREELSLAKPTLTAFGVVADTDAPTPNPATFAVAPAADSDTAISMTATTGTDASGPVEYLFTETSGNPGGTTSAWQTSPSYTDSGLSPFTLYTYTVTMRDALGNTGTASAPANATTAPPTTEIIAVADTFVRGGNASNFGSDPDLEVKLMTGNLTGNFKSVIRFDVGSTDLSTASSINLALVLSVEQDVTDTFHLYGVKNGSALESFGETTLTHANSAVFSDDYSTYPYGIDTTVAGDYFYDSDSNGADVLASFSVNSGTAVGSIVNISTAEMLAFAQDSANSLLTFVLVQTSDTGDKTKFASRENTTYDAPTIAVISSVNAAPTFTADPINEVNATEDVEYSSTIADDATDSDGDPLTYSKLTGPVWLTVATDGSLSGTPAQSDAGANVFTVEVADGNGGTDSATLNITVDAVNDAPVFTVDPINEANATENLAYSGSVANATDADGDPLTYSKATGPAWLVVGTDGSLSGTPGDSDVGANAFTVQVSDGNGGSDSAALNITVDEFMVADQAVSGVQTLGTSSGTLNDSAISDDVYQVLTESGDPSALEYEWTFNVFGGELVTFYVEAYHTANSEGDHFVFAYSTNGTDYTEMGTIVDTVDDDTASWFALPSGLSGSVYVRVEDTDRTVGNNVADSLYVDEIIIVSEDSTVAPNAANAPDPADGSVDVVIDQDLAWTAGAMTVSHDVYFGTNPTPAAAEFQGNQSGTTFDPGVLAYSTTYYWAVDEVNLSGTTTGPVWSFTTAAPANTAPQFTSDPIVEISATENVAYASTLADDASDVDGDSLSFSKLSGPAWLAVASDGTLSGTPMAGDLGLNSWTVQVSDGVDSESATLEISVAASPSWTELTNDDFESGFGNWSDGGSDARLSSSYAIDSQCFAIQDDSNSSEVELSNSLDLTGYSELKIEFNYVVQSFEGSEDFWVRFSDDGGSSWTTIKAYVNDVDFVDDGTRYPVELTIDSGSYSFTSNVKILFECDASANNDDVYIDNVIISAQ